MGLGAIFNRLVRSLFDRSFRLLFLLTFLLTITLFDIILVISIKVGRGRDPSLPRG
jgi:hypothetical protein